MEWMKSKNPAISKSKNYTNKKGPLRALLIVLKH
jgi:hypothetical protein